MVLGQWVAFTPFSLQWSHVMEYLRMVSPAPLPLPEPVYYLVLRGIVVLSSVVEFPPVRTGTTRLTVVCVPCEPWCKQLRIKH